MKAKNTITTTIIIIVIIATIGAVINWSNAKDSERERLNNCIITTAMERGFAGSPYSKQAWETFAPICSKSLIK